MLSFDRKKSLFQFCVIFTCTGAFRVNLNSLTAYISKNLFLERGTIFEILSDCNGILTHKHVVRQRTLNYLAKLVK